MSFCTLSDTQLLEAWARGDRQAGNQLIERHFDLLYRFFRNKARDADIDDLVQQTFLAYVEARQRYDGRASLRTFLLSIARNQLFGFYRKRRLVPSEQSASSLPDEATSPLDKIVELEDERLLWRAMRNVPREAQVVLELAYCEGLVGHEIAQVLGVAATAVHTKLHRARASLRESVRALASDRIAAPPPNLLDCCARSARSSA